jgi:hypothetical protein
MQDTFTHRMDLNQDKILHLIMGVLGGHSFRFLSGKKMLSLKRNSLGLLSCCFAA